jgi:hypothetical protein
MAINPQNKKDAEEIREIVQDTLISISKSMSEAIRVSVEEAVDGVDAKIKDTLGKDLSRSMTSLAKASKDSANNLYKIREGLLSSKDISKQLTAIDEKRLTLAREVRLAKRNGLEIDEEQLGAVNQALKQEKNLLLLEQQRVKEIEKQIGLTGKLVSSLSKIPGIGQFLKADEIDQEMRKAAATGAGRFQTMGIAAKMVGKQLFDGLLDPLTLITAIWDGFMRVDEAATDFTRITGQSTSAISSMNSNLASTVDILQVASDLSREIGIAGNNFISPQQLAAVAETKNLLGLSAEQATKLAIQTKMSGQNVATFKSNVMAGVKQSNLQNKSGVEYGVVIKDILNTSEAVTMSLGNNPKKLAAAATAAKAFGLSLSEVDAIASSLLNFEDSIGYELEAQLLTGKNINLSKARELALNNDLEGVANELAKNGATAAEFAGMQRIEQESLAKALGMSREQLGKSVLAQEASKNLTSKQRADIMGMNELDYERVDIQERIQKSLDKIAQAFAPILEKFIIPAVELLTKIMNLPLVPYFLLAAVAVRGLGLSISGVGKAFGGMYNMGKQALLGIAQFVKAPLDGLKALGTRLAGGFQQGATGMGASSPWSPGKKPGPDPSSMTGGFSKINTADLIKGAAAMAIAAVGIFIFAKAIQELEKIEDWTNVAIGLGAFAVSIGVLGAVGKVAGPGLTALGVALSSFGAAMATGFGALGLVLLTGAAIGLGFALNLAAPGIEAFGTVVTAVFNGLATLLPVIVDGFVTLISAIATGIGPMLLLGPALFGIAAGLGAVALAGISAIPAIGGLVMLAAVAPALASIGIGGEKKSAGEVKGKSEEGGMAALEAKFDTLIELVRQGTTINLDGTKIATSVNRNLARVQVATS